MRHLLDMQKQLVPDLLETLKKRYTVLQHLSTSGMIGRRTLASALGQTERVLRAEVDFLKQQGLVEVQTAGISVSEAGMTLLEQMQPLVQELFGLADIEERIRSYYGLKQVIVVPGDSDDTRTAKSELGRSAASVLRSLVSASDVIAVTGGSTMAAIAQHLTESPQFKSSVFVPARGGLGESLDYQANTIVSSMAKKTGARYRMLHVPDHLSEEAYQSLIQEPNIREIVEVIRSVRIVVHGIGDAMTMARRRKLDETTIEALKHDGALAEAFGYYFDKQGKVVHKMGTVGLRLEDIQQAEIVIAVAGGNSKGEAIASILQYGHEDVLITDEGAAKAMLPFM
ncbi:sugar-binding transcriptional regulator [Paenibacillus sp. y28]|uniref:sugar-binding transcriptional regulator n=1 Tax=Paenibacillus sp. y28 TaxID=3129110 RepID=UPI0030181A10